MAIKNIATLLAALPFGIAKPVSSSGKYIITLKEGIAYDKLSSHLNWVKDMHARSLDRRDLSLVGLEKKFEIGNFSGYSGAFDAATIEEIRKSPDVRN